MTESSDSGLDLVKLRELWAARLDAAAGDGGRSDHQVEMYRAASAARTLISRLVTTDASLDVLRAVADDLESAAAHLGGLRVGSTYEFGEVANGAGATWAEFDRSPLLGRANPLAPPMRLMLSDDMVSGTVTFGGAYEGPPGCVHGGYVAAAFDELLGAAQGLGGHPGMTGTLTVRYRSPTPLGVELTLEGRLERTEGRKTFVSGRCLADGRLTAEAEGIFIAIDASHFSTMRGEHAARVVAGTPLLNNDDAARALGGD